MFGKPLLGAVLVLALQFGSPAWAEVAGSQPSSEAEIPILNGKATSKDVYVEIYNANTLRIIARCNTLKCRSLKDITRVLKIMERIGHPNSLATHWIPSKLDYSRVNSWIAHILLDHPKRRPAYCEILVTAARAYPDYALGFYIINIATIIGEHLPGCLPQVMQSFPVTSETRELAENARETCVADKRSDCGAIVLR